MTTTSQYVSPGATLHDCLNRGPRHAEIAGDSVHALVSHSIALPDAGNVCRGNLRRWINLTTTNARGWHAPSGRRTPLPNHVRVVVGAGAEKEVRGVDARRVVAAVEHAHIRRDRTVGPLPRNPVSERGVVARPESKDAVAVRQPPRGPYPTVRRLLHLLPKPRFRVAPTLLVSALATAPTLGTTWAIRHERSTAKGTPPSVRHTTAYHPHSADHNVAFRKRGEMT